MCFDVDSSLHFPFLSWSCWSVAVHISVLLLPWGSQLGERSLQEKQKPSASVDIELMAPSWSLLPVLSTEQLSSLTAPN